VGSPDNDRNQDPGPLYKRNTRPGAISSTSNQDSLFTFSSTVYASITIVGGLAVK
jgi:hypothetical protein